MIIYKTKIGKGDTKGSSSRTTIPSAIIKLLDLQWGDELVWETTVDKKGLTVTVAPEKVSAESK